MSGTARGGLRAAHKNKMLYGANFYSVIGKLGGTAPYTGRKGFAAHPETAALLGVKGGQNSWKNR